MAKGYVYFTYIYMYTYIKYMYTLLQQNHFLNK